MKFERVRKFAGGVLGEIADALEEIMDSLEGIRAGWGIRLTTENNSLAIHNTQRAKDGFAVAGTPELFKVVTLMGWELDSEGEWTQLSVDDAISYSPLPMFTGQTDAGKYLRPTWDWVRATDEEEA